MNSVVDTMVAAPASAEAQLPSRVLEIRPEESKLVCVGADGREFALSRLVGSNVRIGDEVLVRRPPGLRPQTPRSTSGSRRCGEPMSTKSRLVIGKTAAHVH